jgi:hypothetical protein
LPAVIHPHRHPFRRSVNGLHAKKACAELRPVLEPLRRDPDVTKGLDMDATSNN